MKKFRMLLISIIMLQIMGCASSLTNTGDISFTEIEMPDKSTIVIVDRQKVNFMTPSSEERFTYIKHYGNDLFVRIRNADYLHQQGMGPALIGTVVQSGAEVATGYFIGAGIGKSGDEVNSSISNDSDTDSNSINNNNLKNQSINANFNANKNTARANSRSSSKIDNSRTYNNNRSHSD